MEEGRVGGFTGLDRLPDIPGNPETRERAVRRGDLR